MTDVEAVLHETFGLESFRGQQRDIIDAALTGKDVIVIQPTGAGKSLCYQLPAVCEGGTTVVVSPLSRPGAQPAGARNHVR